MITIEEIKNQTMGRYQRVSATVRIGLRQHQIYFETDKMWRDYLAVDGSSFLAMMLLSALRKCVDIHVEGLVSDKLIKSVALIEKLLHSWGWNDFGRTAVMAKEVKPDVSQGEAIGCFFSGGVDSFYTFFKNRCGNSEKITHFILVHGFDIELNNQKLFDQTLNHISAVAQHEGIKVIVVRTNLRNVIDRYVPWDRAHGSALASVALLLRKAFKRIYIASSNSWDEVFPLGSHPQLDSLWSTETLEIIHDGNESNRLQKVEYIADSDLVKSNLRVCYNNPGNVYNCGKCEKCLRTMIELEIAGVLEETKTFSRPIDLKLLMKVENNPTTCRHYSKSLQELKKRNIYPELQKAIEYMLSPNRRLATGELIKKVVVDFDKKFLDGKLAYSTYWFKKRISRWFSQQSIA